MKPTILIVEDDPTIREVVQRYLEREGFTVNEAADGPTALRMLRESPPDLLILDLMLPGVDGLAITRKLRDAENPLMVTEGDVPIIMLTAKSEEYDRVLGFELGADDYITKPFSPQELVMRVKAVLRRLKSGTAALAERPLQFARLALDPKTREVRLDSKLVDLTAKEFDLLWFLASHPRQVFTRDQLLDQVWGYAFYGDPSTVTVHVRRLREKIEPDAANPTFVQTVWGVGYRFDAD